MMGKLAKVIRLATTVAVGGISGCTREIAAFTYCNVWNMSTFQSKKRSISAEPRLVMERTCCNPGTLLTASSTGRDGDHHLVNRHDPVINGNEDARKIGGGKNRDWNRERKIAAQKRQRENEKDY